jgi:periplasmic protein TonB
MNTLPPRKQESKKSHKRDYRVAAIVAVVVLGAGIGLAHVINGDTTPRKRVMETVSLKLITPPPPPPKQEPPPPPPKMVEKQKIDPPMDKPEAPKPVEAPPAGPLALDAKGGAGSDSFGLGGKPGGADYAPGGGSPYGHYGALAQAQISRLLRQDEKLANGKYHGAVIIWFTPAGGVSRLELTDGGTGDADIDERLRRVLSAMVLPEARPSNLQFIKIKLDARANSQG